LKEFTPVCVLVNAGANNDIQGPRMSCKFLRVLATIIIEKMEWVNNKDTT
jgi:hypothetical protein